MLVTCTFRFFSFLFYSYPFAEVKSTYEQALEQEEERITYQRKMLLLSVKKIRERENEMLIQGKNSLLRKRVEASESELESMLRNMEKQVNSLRFQKGFYASFNSSFPNCSH